VPVFVDIEPDYDTMDPSALERMITPRTKAIVPVHLFGQPADMDPIIDIARRQSAKSLELQATTSQARLLQKQGKEEEAREMLAEIYGGSTKEFDTTDLKEARALLDELS
jgi:hypothetical protein